MGVVYHAPTSSGVLAVIGVGSVTVTSTSCGITIPAILHGNEKNSCMMVMASEKATTKTTVKAIVRKNLLTAPLSFQIATRILD